MGANTKIQWATHTFNPWRGCSKIARGCEHCYAAEQAKRNPAVLGRWGAQGTRVIASEAMWREPIKWNRVSACCCRKEICDHEHEAGCPQRDRQRVFCGSMCDVFEDWPLEVRDSKGGVVNSYNWKPITSEGPEPATLDHVRARLFRLIDATPSLDWMLLTKRPENIRRMWPGVTVERDDSFDPPKDRAFAQHRENVWLGTSIDCQEDADKNIPELLKCRDLAAKAFLSVEPLIGPVDLRDWIEDPMLADSPDQRIGEIASLDWVIVGGESGPNARPCDVAWIRSVVMQCQAVGVHVFVKQLGATVYDNSRESRCKWPGLTQFHHHNSDADDEVEVLLNDSKGGDPAEWPDDLRVREVPR